MRYRATSLILVQEVSSLVPILAALRPDPLRGLLRIEILHLASAAPDRATGTVASATQCHRHANSPQ